jgi:translation initiation factor IF-3
MYNNFYRGPLINNRIRAKEVRLIDDQGKQLGVITIEEALRIAKEKGLDLIQVTEKVEPPVCKIMDQGKYLYNLKKKEKSANHSKGGELKGIRLTFAISDHDMETKCRQAENFLKKGDKIMIELRLKGREKAHQDIAREKIERFINNLRNTVEIKTERELKREPRGFTMIITKK